MRFLPLSPSTPYLMMSVMLGINFLVIGVLVWTHVAVRKEEFA